MSTLPPVRRRTLLGTAAAGVVTAAGAATAATAAHMKAAGADKPLVTYRDQQILVDGKPVRALGGEAVVAGDASAHCQGARVSTQGGRTLLRVRGRTEFTVRGG